MAKYEYTIQQYFYENDEVAALISYILRYQLYIRVKLCPHLSFNCMYQDQSKEFYNCDSSPSFLRGYKGFFFMKIRIPKGLTAYKSNVCCSKILLTFISRSGSSINTAESYEGQAALSFSGLLILGLAAALSLVLFFS